MLRLYLCTDTFRDSSLFLRGWFDTWVPSLRPCSPSSGPDSPTSSAYDTTDGSNSILIASVWSVFPIQTLVGRVSGNLLPPVYPTQVFRILLCLAGRYCVRKMCSTPQKQPLTLHGHGWHNSYDELSTATQKYRRCIGVIRSRCSQKYL